MDHRFRKKGQICLASAAGLAIAAACLFPGKKDMWRKESAEEKIAFENGKEEFSAGAVNEEEDRPEGESSQGGWEERYLEYCRRFQEIAWQSQIEEEGFSIIWDHVFPLEMKQYGEVTLIPALDLKSHRLALFFALTDGRIVYRTDQLETNFQIRGKLDQPNEGIAAVSFQDMDEDGLMDIVLITFCSSMTEEGDQGKHYKIGDVLYQSQEGFYRDWRLSDKINRFSMNKSVQFILSFVKEGGSTEFLYTAVTFEELLEGGFLVDLDWCGWCDFEKWGRLQVVPGFFKMAEYNIFMMYLVNEEGYIVWSFQPMGDYENYYDLRGVRCCDIDGDGLKDVVILADYSYETAGGEMMVNREYSIYYQRTDGFVADGEVKNWYQCDGETSMEKLLEQVWQFWGWG